MKINDKYVFFWGSEFSNFYPYTSNNQLQINKPLNFALDGLLWPTSEHYFMFKKAKFFNDERIANIILNTKHPKDVKKLGRNVKNFDADKWDSVAQKIMFDAVYAKFSQIPELKNFILDKKFDNKEFVEASPLDIIWGIGLHYNDKLCEDKKNWKGKNQLGIIITDVRKKLKNL